METSVRTLTYYVATTLDGFIAGPDGSFDAFPTEGDHIDAIIDSYPDTLAAPALEALGITPTNERFDTVLMGWNTYAAGLPAVVDPYPHLRQHVFTRQHRVPGGSAIATAEKPAEVVRSLKAEPGGSGIWLCGGAQLAGALIDEIDELVLKVNPILFGAGIPLVAGAAFDPSSFERTDSQAFGSGVVINTYRRR
jgi:dihydrofolate reductase